MLHANLYYAWRCYAHTHIKRAIRSYIIKYAFIDLQYGAGHAVCIVPQILLLGVPPDK